MLPPWKVFIRANICITSSICCVRMARLVVKTQCLAPPRNSTSKSQKFESQGKELKLKPPKPPCNEGRNLLFQGNTSCEPRTKSKFCKKHTQVKVLRNPHPHMMYLHPEQAAGNWRELFANTQEAKYIYFKTLIPSSNTAWKSAHRHCNVEAGWGHGLMPACGGRVSKSVRDHPAFVFT